MIDIAAFAYSGIESISYPPKCTCIPVSCFANCSRLSEVSNLQNVTVIKEGAFRNDGSLKLDLSESIIENIAPTAFQGVDSENITFPYYFDA